MVRRSAPANSPPPPSSRSAHGSPDRNFSPEILGQKRMQAPAQKLDTTSSQHANPKSDIEISQAAKKRPILDIAREKLGIPAESLEPYGHYKAKVSMDYVKSLKDRPNGKLILVSAITPTPAGEGKTTTTVGLTDALN